MACDLPGCHFDLARSVLDEAPAVHRALNDRHGLALVLSFTAEPVRSFVRWFVQGSVEAGNAHKRPSSFRRVIAESG
jgi:hypothetical protein